MSSKQKLKAYKNIFSEIEKEINEEDWNTEDGDTINRKLVPFWQRFAAFHLDERRKVRMPLAGLPKAMFSGSGYTGPA